ncbi:glycosyltransferase [Acetobacter estunensis NRIC 0472]|uniref:Glycosyltransferase n=1 Tax=Acetobacter estunensis TaxID=104097 RepID=A0A967B5Q6_9PROT|nr:glycosyltransferase family 1 protein [Acetobacter estunensis]NHO53729.1 glycosyltransferase [Acetobacter estunensis]GBQ20228.1 glycosyltransferase [Acetobacter estunensis NRIC 0472]
MPFLPLSSSPQPRVWFDVEDLFEYARTGSRPSGIQRVAFEIQSAMQALPEMQGTCVGFLRHTTDGRGFTPVKPESVRALHDRLCSHALSVTTHIETGNESEQEASSARRLARHLPASLRVPLGQLVSHQSAAFRDVSALLRATGTTLRQTWTERHTAQEANIAPPRAGDILLALGAPWSHTAYGTLLERARDQGMRTGLLVHDLVPLIAPEWCRPGLPRVFRRWCESTLPAIDRLFAVSHSTRDDIARLFPGKAASVIRMGTGFSTPRSITGHTDLPLSLRAPFVLVVGTIEVRKNHALLFRLWRKLLADHPRATIPRLVMAGSPGWLASDLMQQIRNCNFLNGHIALVHAPSDALLEALYRHALFTLVPSLHEGWGLPVTESLAHGTPCLIANRGALPEAGGRLTPLFDPDNLHDVQACVERVIHAPAELARLRSRIATTFQPTPWSVAAQQLLSAFH